MISTAIFSISFVYYALLSSKQFTWLFASGDSGDWLASSTMWVVPQPYGSPLYIMLGHLLNLLPGDMVIKMTVLLSCLPASITVALVYLITKKLTDDTKISIIASGIVLSAGIFLTQSTILEEYALAVMFLTLGYYFYLLDKKALVALALGLGSAIHIVVVAVALIWLLVERKQARKWLKVLPIYIVTGILPYGLILYLMTTDAPPLLAGYGLSLEAINSYLGSTAVFGTLPLLNFPLRLGQFLALIIMSFGLSLLALKYAFKKPFEQHTKLLLVAVAFPLYYYLTCQDPTAWTFMTYSVPFIAISIGIGLTRLKPVYLTYAVTSILLLFALNTVALNADNLAKYEPNATNYLKQINTLPDGSALIMHRGGADTMTAFYAIAQGKQIIPIYTTGEHYDTDALYQNYLKWLDVEYGLKGTNTQELTVDALDKGLNVYALYPLIKTWLPLFQTNDTGMDNIKQVTGVNETAKS